ncbi:MAG: DUF1801 domain-containing protein [Planctomycetes bacterium]|nr:DUF1801 domain-containing protein [Planctomycetota bacterium]NOG54904.1 DUF1801 domain-containing protein [Planctomycetota bacterium]
MAELKTKKTRASVEKFLNGVKDEGRREDCFAILKMMQQATRSEPSMWGSSIVGFGSCHLKYASGRELDWFLVGFAPRKNDLTLYIMPGFDKYGDLLGQLGKHKTGKSCLYIKRLTDVDRKVLKQLITESVRHMKKANK